MVGRLVPPPPGYTSSHQPGGAPPQGPDPHRGQRPGPEDLYGRADGYQAPDGYPIKGNVSFGLYYTPSSALYHDTIAEIWFASEEAAQANGFVKAD